jgi:hypothetical protein
MEKRSIDKWSSDDHDLEEEFVWKEIEPEMVQLRLMKSVNLITTGPVTGKEYRFMGAGSVVDVDKLDENGLLAKTSGGCNCPGSAGASPYFEQVR